MTPEKQRPDDIDRALARLISEHHALEDRDLKQHIRECKCCASISLMLAALRRDMHDLAERRVA